MAFAIADDYQYNETHKRRRITIWVGAFASQYVADGYSLPKGDGFMVTTPDGGKVRVTTDIVRTDKNFMKVDAAIGAALTRYYAS